MNKALLFAAVFAVSACSGSSGSDGGAGGGTASTGGGTTSAGGGAATGGGSTAGGGGTATGGGTGSISESQLCASIVTATCDYYVRCGGFASSATCATFLGGIEGGGGCASDQFASIDAGRATYHGDQAAACIALLTNASCAGGLDGIGGAACDATFVGNVPVGSACAYSSDCVPTAFCSSQPGTCGGACRALVAVGQPVTASDQCVSGGYPYNGFCISGLPPGQRCDPADGGTDLIPCASGAGCTLFNVGGNSVELCAVGADAGEPCIDATAAVSGCNGFAYCDSTSMLCTPLQPAQSACDRASFNQCQAGLWCDGTSATPTCVPLSPTGGVCGTDADCAFGACDGGVPFNLDGGAWTPGSCVTFPGLNAPCTGACAAGFYCDEATSLCLTPAPDGTPCTSGEQCASSECNSRDGGNPVCGLCE